MPASSSVDARTRWRSKRKRQPQIGQRPKPQDDEDDEEDDDQPLEQQQDFHQGHRQHHEISKSRLDPYNSARETEVHSRAAAEKISDFPPAIKQRLVRPHPSVSLIVALEKAIQNGESKTLSNGVVFENISHGQLQALSAVPRDSPSLLPPGEQERFDGASSSSSSAAAAPSYVITPPPVMEGRGVIKRFGGDRILVLPMHADWFTPNSVHRLERQVLPHFFTGKSNDHNPEKYIGCRNLIVSKYMENPEKSIKVSDFEGLGVGIDIDDLTRIVRFLDNWGIINYCSSSSSSRSSEPLNPDSCLKEDSNGEVQVPSAALKSIDSLILFDKPKCRLKAADVYPLSSRVAEEEDCDLDLRIRERLSENKCSYCSCTPPTGFYQSQKEVDVLVCFDCYNDGRFLVGHSSLDFVKIDSTKGIGDLDSESWTDQETLLLLEAIEIHNDNWNEIAKHVGTKSKAQCILQFVRLPMEDGQLENIQVPNDSQVSNGDDPRRPDLYPNEHSAGPSIQESDPERGFPFANSKNPVMSLVAFLTSAVGPRVAAACAHTSLAVLTSDDLPSSENIEQSQLSRLANRRNLESFCNKDGNHHGENANSSLQKGDSGLQGFSSRGKKLRDAAQAGLSAAATKAKLFADHEEREIQRLSANIINNQLKRLELKLKQFAEIETLLMKECEQVERTRLRLAGDRARILSGQFVGQTSGLQPGGAAATAAANSIRQQLIQTPSSVQQPFVVPGYGSNQAIHPQFMPRQSMYGLGPRLPLSAINASSTPANSMFNNLANAQSSVNHHPNSGLGS